MALPNGFTGTIVSGTGGTYQVLLNNGSTVSANCIVIADSETIPVGYPVIVALVGRTLTDPGTYWFQVPIWGS